MSEQEIRYDIEGYEALTEALKSLMDHFPALEEGENFRFSWVEEAGVTIFPSTGAVIQIEVESITGHVTQMCQYPFTVVYRLDGLSEKGKMAAKEWMDNLGRWLEKQPVTIGSETHKLVNYPKLSGSREIRNIYRQTPAYLQAVNTNKSEDWVMQCIIQYRNEFDK